MIAPEALKPGYDHRVDVWGVGVIFYMMLTYQNLFNNVSELQSGMWSISTHLNCSVEALRFLNEILTYDKNLRPFPD